MSTAAYTDPATGEPAYRVRGRATPPPAKPAPAPEPRKDIFRVAPQKHVNLKKLLELQSKPLLDAAQLKTLDALQAEWDRLHKIWSQHNRETARAEIRALRECLARDPSEKNLQATKDQSVSLRELEDRNERIRRAAKEALHKLDAVHVHGFVGEVCVRAAELLMPVFAKQTKAEQDFCELAGCEFEPSPVLHSFEFGISRLRESKKAYMLLSVVPASPKAQIVHLFDLNEK